MKKIRSFLSLLMVVSILAGLLPAFAAEMPENDTERVMTGKAVSYSKTVTFTGDYTYLDRVSTLSANWNPHNYDTSDQSYPISYLTTGLYSFIFNDELNPVEGRAPYEGYVIVPEMAAELPIDVTEQVKAEGKFDIPDDATSGYAYIIKLNPLACWEDGTPITADDYVESMKRLLDSRYLNYRAGGYYEGSFCIVGAENFYKSGKVVDNDNSATGAIAALTDLVKGEDGNYYTADGGAVRLAINYPFSWCGGNTLKQYVDTYGDAYFALDTWQALVDMMDDDGLVPLNDETIALLLPVITGNPAWGETDADLVNYFIYEKNYPIVNYDDTVGLYKTGDYEITLVLGKYLTGFNLLYNLTGNWLVKCDLYDACMKEEVTASGSIWTSTYNTSVETTCSYGPYKLTNYQADKSMHFVKNENWFGYTDGKHVYVDPIDGLTYPMYQTTAIDCQVVADVDTARELFLKGQLMTYGLQTEDFDDYRDSEFCHFIPGQATFFLLLNGNMDAIKTREASVDFDQSAYDLETLTLISFHRAMGLAYDRDLYCETCSPADSGAFGLIGHAYIADPETGVRYRDTEAAKLALCEVYGVDVNRYASLDDAVDSITGYDPARAREYFKKAFTEALDLGYVTDTNGDGICDQTIQLTYSASSLSNNTISIINYLTKKANEITAGTPFENKIEFVASAPLGAMWSNHFKDGLTDTCLAGWTGSAMDPYGLIEVFTNPTYQYDAAWFDATTVDMTLTIDGETITMNLQEWEHALNGTPIKKNGKTYNFGDGKTAADNRVLILAGLEKTILLEYNYLPFVEDGSMELLTQKAYYVVEEYNPVMGRGGITYLRYNYNDAEWAEYVAACGGELDYSAKKLNGLNKDSDGVWRYYENNKVATDFTGFVKHINGKYYFVNKGVVKKTTGFVKHTNGKYYYIQNGVKSDIDGFVKHTNGKYYYVQNGMMVDTTGLVKHTNGKYYYIVKGVKQDDFTGLVKHTNGKYYYIVKGVKQDDFTGLVKHTNGKYYYVLKGQMQDNFTGLAKHTNKKFYYVEKGIWKKVTALVPHTNGKLYYVKDGIHDNTFNGSARTLDGKLYRVVNGIAQP